jgi:hypothetical protein
MTELVSMQASVEYAKLLSASDLLPAAYKNKPANILLAIEYGKTLGITPMAAIQGINVIQGKPTASAGLISGLVRRAGHKLRITSDSTKAICEIIRKDDPDFIFITVWDMDRAKAAGLLDKGGSWKTYPEAMMKARAITECARDACPEVLSGVAYTAEELGVWVEDETPGKTVVEPVEIEPVEAEIVEDAE